ncbi:hypothetical protein [Mariprofundus ferrinatatus]|uniref:hypothetical protein n=1 Tax=Mariprofundus ferrinatatus TaxID=1921087 RepID=UPI000C22C32C|nr:hypothetical protein [Mariprofundus ferrinatatus]
MVIRKLHIRGVSRLVAGLFALQLFAGAFCMMAPELHAAPMSQMASHSMVSHDMAAAEHCAPPVHQTQNSGDQSACSHCNQPDELLQSAQLQFATDLPLFLYVGPPLQPAAMQQPVMGFASQVPTGPPKSSTLLYHTTQRIRI